MKKLALLLALAGCVETNEKQTQYLRQYYTMISDPHQYLQYLESREYIIPDNVFDAYANAVEKRPIVFWIQGPSAAYISRNFLEGEERESFQKQLARQGYTKEESEIFSSILCAQGNIVLKESLLQDSFFQEALCHERVHREVDALSSEEKDVLRQAYDGLKSRSHPQRKGEFLDDKDEYSGVISSLVYANGNEFPPYLATGAFKGFVEDSMFSDFPAAYAIFQRVKRHSSLKKSLSFK